MAEPASTAAGGIALSKLLGIGLFALLAVVVVMAMTLPRTPREFVVALICTLVASIGGGAAVIQWFGIQPWSLTLEGQLAHGAIYFSAGLPAWVSVRAWFAYTEAAKGRTLLQLVRDLREVTGR